MVQTFSWQEHGLRLSLTATNADLRATLAQEIHTFHDRSVPHDAQRFALVLNDTSDLLCAGLSAVMSWQWLFIEALWVADAWRRRGIGRALIDAAERHAFDAGCHSAWLDTFQARQFYEALGYRVFGMLEDYPPGQSRSFLRKRLLADR